MWKLRHPFSLSSVVGTFITLSQGTVERKTLLAMLADEEKMRSLRLALQHLSAAMKWESAPRWTL